MRHWLHDVRFASIRLRRSPWFAAVTTTVLALAIGAVVTLVSFARAVLFAPLPYDEPERLLALWEHRGVDSSYRSQFSVHDFYFVKDRLLPLMEMEAVGTPLEANLLAPGSPVQVRVAATTTGFLRTFGVAPALGALPSDDAAADGAVILSYALYERLLHVGPTVVGQTISVDGRAMILAAVMPRGFKVLQSAIDGGKLGSAARTDVDVWEPAIRPPAMAMQGHMVTLPALRVVGRLVSGVSANVAAAQLKEIGRELVQQSPEHQALGTRLEALPMHEEVFGDVRPLIATLFAVVGLVLFGACASIANLLLTRFRRGARDLALLSAMGAGWGALVRVVLAEAAILAAIGGFAGLVLAAWATRTLTVMARGLPRVDEVAIDTLALVSTAGLMGFAVLAVSVVPALRALRLSPVQVMKPAGQIGGGSRWSGRDLAIVVQVSLSLILLAGAARVAVVLRSYETTDLGYDSAAVSVVKLALPADQYQRGPARLLFIQQVTAALERQGAARVAGVWPAPFSGDGLLAKYGATVGALASTADRPAVYRAVTAGLFDVLGLSLLDGRDFGPSDFQGQQRVVILSSQVARNTFGGQTAVGRSMWLDIDGVFQVEATVVGVVPDIVDGRLRDGRRPAVYMPYGAVTAQRILWLAARDGNSGPLTTAQATATVRSLNPMITVSTTQRLSDFPDAELRPLGLVATTTVGFAWLAVAMTAVGLYGLVATLVAGRTREIGLRLSLGATRVSVIRLVAGRVVFLVAAGLLAGAVGAGWFGRALGRLMFGVTDISAVTVLAMSGLLAGVALVAVWAPIRRALRIDPADALRAD